MNRNARITYIRCGVVLFVCAAFFAAACCGFNYISRMKETLEYLTDEHNALDRETAMMIQRKRVYERAFKELDKLRVGGVGANVDFYSEAQRAIRRGGARVLSNAPNAPRDGRISMRMSFSGDYYAVIKALAELRELPNAVRVVTLNLDSANPDSSASGDVMADIVLEALAYSNSK